LKSRRSAGDCAAFSYLLKQHLEGKNSQMAAAYSLKTEPGFEVKRAGVT
jgi:hypothetical protein